MAVLAVADNAIPLVSGTIYNQVYKRMIHSNPAAIFYVTIASQVIVMMIFM